LHTVGPISHCFPVLGQSGPAGRRRDVPGTGQRDIESPRTEWQASINSASIIDPPRSGRDRVNCIARMNRPLLFFDSWRDPCVQAPNEARKTEQEGRQGIPKHIVCIRSVYRNSEDDDGRKPPLSSPSESGIRSPFSSCAWELRAGLGCIGAAAAPPPASTSQTQPDRQLFTAISCALHHPSAISHPHQTISRAVIGAGAMRHGRHLWRKRWKCGHDATRPREPKCRPRQLAASDVERGSKAADTQDAPVHRFAVAEPRSKRA
jgi:hypothetical protein